MGRWAKAKLIAVLVLAPFSAMAETSCYTQKWSNATSTSCDDGTRINTYGKNTVEIERPRRDGTTERETIQRYGDRVFKSDGTMCSKIGSTWTCR